VQGSTPRTKRCALGSGCLSGGQGRDDEQTSVHPASAICNGEGLLRGNSNAGLIFHTRRSQGNRRGEEGDSRRPPELMSKTWRKDGQRECN